MGEAKEEILRDKEMDLDLRERDMEQDLAYRERVVREKEKKLEAKASRLKAEKQAGPTNTSNTTANSTNNKTSKLTAESKKSNSKSKSNNGNSINNMNEDHHQYPSPTNDPTTNTSWYWWKQRDDWCTTEKWYSPANNDWGTRYISSSYTTREEVNYDEEEEEYPDMNYDLKFVPEVNSSTSLSGCGTTVNGGCYTNSYSGNSYYNTDGPPIISGSTTQIPGLDSPVRLALS